MRYRVLLRNRVELTCLYCGHALGDVFVPGGRRPTMRQLRAAYAAAPNVIAPAWDAHGNPHCPRCAARLFMEVTAPRLRLFAEARVVRPAPARAAQTETREDDYAREDVYVGADAELV